MKKGEVRECTGLFIINQSGMSSWFYEVNKDKTKIIAQYHYVINDRVIFSLNKISDSVNNLPNFNLIEYSGKLRYVWGNLFFHINEDIKGCYISSKNANIYKKNNKVLFFLGANEIKIDSIQVLDKEKAKIYQQTMDSLEKAKAPVFLYGV